MTMPADLSSQAGGVRILGIAGSLRVDSYNRALLRAAAKATPTASQLTIWDQLKAIPPFDEDDEVAPAAAVLDLRAAIATADALLVVTPEYNASLPGQLKNALDWASRPRSGSAMRGKPVAVCGTSPSPSGARSAQADLRRILARSGAEVIDTGLAIPDAHVVFGADGELTDPHARRELAGVLRGLTSAAGHTTRIAA